MFAVRELFQKAREGAPSVVFLDELDTMVGKRGAGASQASERILSTLLNEMDGVVAIGQVICVGATNRVDMIDSALLRPGRFDHIVYVGAPDEKSRLAIFKVHTRKMPLDCVDLELLALESEGLSGAEIENQCREAGLSALRRGAATVTMEDFGK